MAITYKHRITGRTVDLAEPAELAEQLAGVMRRGRPIHPKRILLAKKRRERLIVKMNECWKWQRTATQDSGDTGAAEASEGTNGGGGKPADADVRAWAAAEGIEVPARGKLSTEVVEQYKTAHAATV